MNSFHHLHKFLFICQINFIKPRSKIQYCVIFSPEWVKTWVGSLTHFLRPTFSRQKQKKRPEISRFQVFYGCGGRTRTCGLRVMSCSEASIHCNARVSLLFCPQKSGKTRRPSEFAPRLINGLSRKWVGIWVRADSGSSRNEPLKQRRGFFLLCMIFRSVKQSPRSIVLYLPSTTESSYLAQQLGRHKQGRSLLLFCGINHDFEVPDKL